MKTMLSADYEPETDLLVLRFDEEVQTLFATGARQMTALLGPNDPLSALQNDAAWFEDIGIARMMLDQLGMGPSRTLRVRSEYLCTLFNLICLTILRVSESGGQVGRLRDLVMFLAAITPAEIQPGELPPTKKVFNRAKTESAVWNSYQFLRSWRSDKNPELPVIYAHALWEALSQTSNPNEQLKSLRANLDNETLLFRWAKETFATSKTPDSQKKRTK